MRIERSPWHWTAYGVAVLLAYLQTSLAMMERWNAADYLHCYLVVPFAAGLLYVRREFAPDGMNAGTWWGLPLLLAGVGMRIFAAFSSDPVFDPLSLVPTLLGAAMFLGGRPLLRWAAPSILFLVFLIPLPSFLATILSLPLQRAATVAGAYLLQICGIPVLTQGNVITLPSADLNVAEACSGLKMLVLFFAVCVGAALLLYRKSWPFRSAIVLSAVPIAIVSNVARIAITGILYEIAAPELAESLFHDMAGLLMMPLAMVLLWLEMVLLDRLLLDERRKCVRVVP